MPNLPLPELIKLQESQIEKMRRLEHEESTLPISERAALRSHIDTLAREISALDAMIRDAKMRGGQ